MGLCICYDELLRIDVGLAQHIIDLAGSNRVPVPSSFLSNHIIHEAMDNFDHEENTSSGIGGSHDTILMLFQNCDSSSEDNVQTVFSQKLDTNANRDKRALSKIIDCQELQFATKHPHRAEIPSSFVPNAPVNWTDEINSSEEQYLMWGLSRYLKNDIVPNVLTCQTPNIPSFAATNSLLH